MRRKPIILLTMGVVLSFLSLNAISAEKVWVSADGAALKAEADATAPTIAELPKGTELSVMTSDKKWFRVKTGQDKEGWIYRGKVSTDPPQQGESGGGSIGNLLGDLSGSSVQADSADTARSIRGLSPEAKEYAKQTGASADYQRALDEVTAIKIGKVDVDQFLKQGKIGEYAD